MQQTHTSGQSHKLRIWLPAIRTHSGSDIYTMRLCSALNRAGIDAQITWYPHSFEFAPSLLNTRHMPADRNIIHANSWNSFAFSARELPLVATAHHCVMDPELSPYKTRPQHLYHRYLIQRYERKSLATASAVVAVSEYTARIYSSLFNIPKPAVIPNWIDTSLYSPARTRERNSIFRLLFIGNLTRRKGADLLPEIMGKLGSGYELHTTGGLRGTGRKHTCGHVEKQHGYLPKTEDMIKLYRSCDALLFPSRLEGFGLAALEAQACGLPVIATDGSAFPEVVANKTTGILCPKDNITAFVTAIRSLKEQPEKLAELGRNARKYIMDNFSETKILPMYISLYRQLLP